MNFVAFAAISCLIFAFTCFDITGQTTRVPAASDVTKVDVETLKPFETTVKLTDSDSIAKVTELHKAVLSHKASKDTFTDSDNSLTVSMKYTLKNGTTLNRRYTVDASDMEDVLKAAAELGASDEYITKTENHMHKVGLHAAEGNYIYTGKAELSIKKEDIRPLIQAFMEDYKVNGFRYYYDLANSAASDTTNRDYTTYKTGLISISFNPSTALDDVNDIDSLEESFTFGKKDKNTLAFLKENGYEKKILKLEKESSSEKDA